MFTIVFLKEQPGTPTHVHTDSFLFTLDPLVCSSLGMSITVFVKPTATGDRLTIEQVDPETLVADLKVKIAEKCSIPAPEQRVIYKGSILKDERTLASYGEAGNFWTA